MNKKDFIKIFERKFAQYTNQFNTLAEFLASSLEKSDELENIIKSFDFYRCKVCNGLIKRDEACSCPAQFLIEYGGEEEHFYVTATRGIFKCHVKVINYPTSNACTVIIDNKRTNFDFLFPIGTQEFMVEKLEMFLLLK